MAQAKAKAKAENYSAADTKVMVARYTSVDATDLSETAHDKRLVIVKELAKEFGKNDRSIISKLVSQKVYVKRGAVSKVTKGTPEKKEAIAEKLVKAFGQIKIDGKMVGLNADSMEKANKTDLATLLFFFNSLVVDDATDGAPAEIDPDLSGGQESE